MSSTRLAHLLLLVSFRGCGATPILPPSDAKAAREIIGSLTDWIMTLDLGSGTVKHIDIKKNPLNHSIFINGNLARVLIGSYRLTGNVTHRDEALRWCDSLVAEQVHVQTATQPQATGGYWGVGYPTSKPLRDGDLYLGDTGSAVTTLAQCAWVANDSHDQYVSTLSRFSNFVHGGCQSAGCGASWRGAAATTGFINASAGGSVGCGYYAGHLSTCPYVIATATTGAAYMSEYSNLVGSTSPAAASKAVAVVEDAVKYMGSLVSPDNGTVPYQIDCQQPDWHNWPLDTISYVTEGVIGAALHVPRLRSAIINTFRPTAEWLVTSQGDDGAWGHSGADRQRSPRVSSLLALFIADALEAKSTPDPRYLASLRRYVAFLVKEGAGGGYGLEDVLTTSGFVGLALLEMLDFGVTFGPTSKGVGR